MVKSIQRSPYLLRKKFLGKSAESPVPPARRRRAGKIVESSWAEVAGNELGSIKSLAGEIRSRSVSAEDVDELIESADEVWNFRPRSLSASRTSCDRSSCIRSRLKSSKIEDKGLQRAKVSSRSKLKASPPPEEVHFSPASPNLPSHTDRLGDSVIEKVLETAESQKSPKEDSSVSQSFVQATRHEDGDGTVVSKVTRNGINDSASGPILRKAKNNLKPRSMEPSKFMARMTRFREKFILCLSAIAIAFTLLVVMDLQLDLGYSGHHLVASHGKIQTGDALAQDSVYNSFRRKFLQRVNGSRELSGDVPVTSQMMKDEARKDGTSQSEARALPQENFTDLLKYAESTYGLSAHEGVVRVDEESYNYNPTIAKLKGWKPR